MEWLKNLVTVKKQDNAVEVKKETVVIDMMKDDVDPEEVTIENAYKTRWIWYHTILAIEIAFTNILLVAILMLIAIKF